MPKRHDKITKSVNYDYYWDILFCTVPLLAVSCFYYGARPLLMMAAGLLTAYVADCVVTCLLYTSPPGPRRTYPTGAV